MISIEKDTVTVIYALCENYFTCGYELRAMREGKTHIHEKHDGH